ncbi:MAG: AI-2E family transporter [Megasphaera sp.]|uniref:AI-2E family transporter n=1 Tax=Megasphaera sp. TaxID=2023260 RepID=UPI003F044F26
MVAYKTAEFWLRVSLAILAGALFLTAHAVYWPIVISLILTFILMPIRDGIIKGIRRLTGRKLPVDLAILLSFVVLIAIVTVITNIIVKPLIVQVNLLAANFNDLVSQTAALVSQLENEQTQFYIPEQVKKIINDAFVKVGNYGIDGISNLLQSVFAIAGTVVEFFVVPIITFYFMKDGGSMVEDFVKIFPESYRAHLAEVFHEVQHVLSRYIRGQIMMSCIIATLTFFGMWILGVPYAMVIGLLAAITEWIPIVGPIFGAVPAILLSATVSLSLPLKVIIFYIVIQQIDSHLIMPQVMGAVISLHPVVIVIALLIGGTLFGVAGMILTVPVTAVLQIICKHLWFYNSYREKAMKQHGN